MIGALEGDGSCFPYWYGFDGIIDEFMFYNRILNDTEALCLSNGDYLCTN